MSVYPKSVITEAPIAILTIAGSDCSAGAGLQADLKTFQSFGLHGLTAVTCVVSETANHVSLIHTISPEMMEDQIYLLIDSFPVTVVKTGMLGTAEHVRRVAKIFQGYPEISLVVDPVIISTTGTSLLEASAVEIYQNELFPLAKLITPNLPEAECLLNRIIPTKEAMENAVSDLARQYGCDILLKGGHLLGQECTDLLFTEENIHHFTHKRLNVSASHGTGCTLAAAIASCLALGKSMTESVSIAKSYLVSSLESSYHFKNRKGESIHVLNQGTRT